MDDEMKKRQHAGFLRFLVEAWKDPEADTQFTHIYEPTQEGDSRPYLSADYIRIKSATRTPDGIEYPPLSTAKTLAIAILVDDDQRAAAALADLMVESGVDAFTAERARLRKELVELKNYLQWNRPGNIYVTATLDAVQQRLLDEPQGSSFGRYNFSTGGYLDRR